jgi:hypothetical protein
VAVIGPHDRIRLPEGVELRDGALVDVVRLSTMPVNAAGLATLAEPTPLEAAGALSRRHGIDADTALRDVLRFCAELNARFLLNVAARGGRVAVAWRWLGRVPFLLPLGLVPTLPTARRAVDTTSVRSLARTAPAALVRFALLLLVTGAGSATLLLGAAGAASRTLAVTLGVAISGSVAVHELAHLAALRGVPACVVTRGLRIAVVHRAASRRRTRAVAASGPAAGLALGACLVGLVYAWPSSELGAAALVALSNALGLTVVSRDGRTLCGLP